jgi:hypothetical protein
VGPVRSIGTSEVGDPSLNVNPINALELRCDAARTGMETETSRSLIAATVAVTTALLVEMNAPVTVPEKLYPRMIVLKLPTAGAETRDDSVAKEFSNV